IAASPTGSTAYALSAGGPIVHPAMRAFILVPVCPHTLTNRPIALPGHSHIEVVLVNNPGEIQLTLDGQINFALQDGDRVHIQRDEHNVHLLSDPHRNYFDVLREKFSWGERN
ncbi:MAG: NAD(+)/NADH kinase, partial [Thiohalorhabdaceae bacterium]